MRDKYVKTSQMIQVVEFFDGMCLTIMSCLAAKVELFRGEVDVLGFDEAVGEEEPRPRLQRLPPAEPQGRYELRGRGEDRMNVKGNL